jgi:glycosyltransferase involved in cell wall biosynthesis
MNSTVKDFNSQLSADERVRVLMITGIYLPERNGAVMQCSQLMARLKQSINFSVLTGTNDPTAAGSECIDGIAISRVYMPRERIFKYIFGGAKFYLALLRSLAKVDLVHFHGYSKRNALAMVICRLLRRSILIKMTSFGYDDPLSVKRGGILYWMAFKCSHAYIGLSPAFQASYQLAGMPTNLYFNISNGVDLARYAPVSANKREVLRERYKFASDDKLIIFVGHFSDEKQPLLLYKAWIKLLQFEIDVKLLFIGRTKNHFEVNDEIIEIIKDDAIQRGVLQLIHFVEDTSHVHECMQIADIFVLPSLREGLPNALLEAMACELPCVVRFLPGVTDWLIDDKNTGSHFFCDDSDELAKKILFLFAESESGKKMGLAAREFIEKNFSIDLTSKKLFELYKKILEIST